MYLSRADRPRRHAHVPQPHVLVVAARHHLVLHCGAALDAAHAAHVLPAPHVHAVALGTLLLAPLRCNRFCSKASTATCVEASVRLL